MMRAFFVAPADDRSHSGERGGFSHPSDRDPVDVKLAQFEGTAPADAVVSPGPRVPPHAP